MREIAARGVPSPRSKPDKEGGPTRKTRQEGTPKNSLGTHGGSPVLYVIRLGEHPHPRPTHPRQQSLKTRKRKTIWRDGPIVELHELVPKITLCNMHRDHELGQQYRPHTQGQTLVLENIWQRVARIVTVAIPRKPRAKRGQA